MKVSVNTASLFGASICYLALPYFIFFLGWLSLPISIFLSLLLAATIYKNLSSEANGDTYEFAGWPFVISILVLGTWLYLSGIGGFYGQYSDFHKHMAIYNDLTVASWPVTYEHGSVSSAFPLIYYSAFYLPPALAAKTFGTDTLGFAAVAWAAIGLFLIYGWLCVLWRKVSIILTSLLILFSGLDFIGYFIQTKKLPLMFSHIEWWAGHWQFSSMSCLLFWVPQHALAGWLLAAIFIHEIRKERVNRFFFLGSLSLFWSPFVSIGLIPLFAYGLLTKKIKHFFNPTNLTLFVTLFTLFFLYYTSKPPDISHPVWNLQNFSWLKPNIIFLTLEIGVFLGILAFAKFTNKERNLIILCGLFCLALTSYKFGMYNDIAMRASIPALFIIMFFVGEALNKSKRLILKSALSIALLAGSVTSIFEIGRKLNSPHPIFPLHNITNIHHLGARQYLGTQNSAFNVISKKPKANLKVHVPALLARHLNNNL